MLFLTTNATGPGWCTALPCWEWDGTSLQQIQPASGSAFTVVHQTRHKPTNRQKRHGTSTRLSEGEVTYCTQREKERERETRIQQQHYGTYIPNRAQRETRIQQQYYGTYIPNRTQRETRIQQ